MNKKFFTLIASAFMLVASVGTMNAQVTSFGDPETGGLSQSQQERNLYHLIATTGDSTFYGALNISQNGRLYLTDTASYAGSLGSTLWCINVEDAEDQGRTPTFQFTNRGSDHVLRVSPEDLNRPVTDSIDVQFGSLSRWNFSLVYKDRLETKKPFVLYYTTDRVLALVRTTANQVGVESFPGDYNFDPTLAANANILYFTVYRPAELILNANQFNTIINTERPGYVTLSFTPAPSEVSEFQTAIRATDVPVSQFGPGATNNWLMFERNTTDANTKYLRVDTAYTGAYGTRFLKFAWGDGPSTATPQKASIQRQYYFQARYNILNDSLAIDVMEAKFPEEGYTGYWYTYGQAGYPGHVTEWYPSTYPTAPRTGGDSLHVKLQDLIAGQVSLLTIGTREVSTRIGLGLKGCGVPDLTFTSVPSNLYVIRNNKGQYLIVPINTDTLNNNVDLNRRVQWADLDNVTDPTRIPAYQWVVEQTRTDFPTTSPIKITNREFGPSYAAGVSGDYHTFIPTYSTIQLTNTGSSIQLYGETVYASNFIAVPDAQKRDKNLGYKYLPEDSLRFNTYDFNYLHTLNTSTYLYVGGTDSSVILNNNNTERRTQFELISQSAPRPYGYWTPNVANLAKLEKVAYVIRVKDGNALRNNGSVMFSDSQQRYAVSKNNVDTAIFLLKTNNTFNGRDYYAMLDTGSYSLRRQTPLGTRVQYKDVKLGIRDGSGWAYEQTIAEDRTSAFYIAPYNEPLYRRFDGATYGKYQIKEPYGNSTNAPVWLKFAKHNNWGKEYLFENSPRGKGGPGKNVNDYRDGLSATGQSTISFLGLYNIEQYPENNPLSNYTFYVDTAYVRYNTPMPQYMLAVRPEFVKGDTIWTVRKDSTWNSQGQSWSVTYDTTMTVRPSYTRAFYVFNAQDSIGNLDADNYNPRNADYVGKVQYGAEYTTRLAFVDGVHMGDTFYVLRNKPATSEIDSAFLLRIPAYDKIYLGRNTHYRPRFGRNNLPLWGNSTNYYNDSYNGKSMVFQFRLYDPEGSTEATIEPEKVRKFMIESRSDTTDVEIGPSSGRWMKIQNGVPIISQQVNLTAAKNDGAEVMNVLLGEENNAVSNEKNPEASSVQVTGEYGGVNILNAAGANVTVTNILGQTVASKYINSDNETISVPKGIVVVAVDGEAFKAVVK